MQRIYLNKTHIREIVDAAKNTLEKNGLVVFPSDTVYGLAVNACSEKAVNKLIEFKDRPSGKAISIAVESVDAFSTYSVMSKQQRALLAAILPGPFTVVLPSTNNVSKKLEAEDNTIGIRFPHNAFMNTLSKALSFPYTATSANLRGKSPHYSLPSFLHSLSQKKQNLIDLVIDGGELPHVLPSTVINLATHQFATLRTGNYSFEKIFEITTRSEEETKQYSANLVHRFELETKNKPLVFILQGAMGNGKTVFAQGVGEYLQTVHVVSPTFVTYYEYATKNPHITSFHHFDLFKIDQESDLKVLSISSHLKPRNVLVFEWGEKLGSIFQLFNPKDCIIIFVSIESCSETERTIVATKLA